MTSTIEKLNAFSGILSMISIIAAILFYFASIQGDVLALREEHKILIKALESQMELTRNITYSLQDKKRDHADLFAKLDNTERCIQNIEKVMMRLEITLNSLDKKLEQL